MNRGEMAQMKGFFYLSNVSKTIVQVSTGLPHWRMVLDWCADTLCVLIPTAKSPNAVLTKRGSLLASTSNSATVCLKESQTHRHKKKKKVEDCK